MASHTLFSSTCTPTRCWQPDCRKPDPFSNCPAQNLESRRCCLQTPWLGITKLSLQTSKFQPFFPKTRPITATATASLGLPTGNPEKLASIENVPKWSSKAIRAVSVSEVDVRKLKYTTTGTEALLMGILVDGTSVASRFLRANGITLSKVREETIKLLGFNEMLPPPDLNPPLTESAQKALDWALDDKLKSGGDGEITTCHLLLGVWYQEESPGHKILANLGFNEEKAKKLHSVISKPGFSDD